MAASRDPRARDDVLAAFASGEHRRARFSVWPPSPPPLPELAQLQAGAAEVDITPPPGMPKAGYSRNARTGAGFRTRLRARIVHLRCGPASMAIVQCDLLGGSAVVQHLVAEAVRGATDVPLAGLFIGATHTHAGPGQFLGTDFYNRFASNRPGFDPGYTRFLVERIAGAVDEAVATRRPAALAVGRTEVWGLTRNRSVAPHLRNPDTRTLDHEWPDHDGAAPDDDHIPPQRKFTAVNPWLHLLRVDARTPDGGLEPMAAAVVFSVHGTGVPVQADEYNADIWAYLTGELTDRIERAHGTRPVVGAMEGTHADVAPAVRPGLAGHLEAARVGRAVGAEAAGLFESLGHRLADRVELGAGLHEIDLDHGEAAIDGMTLPGRPAVGAALVAGAHENVTPVIHRIPPFRAGSPKRWGTDNPQGPKWVIGSRWLQPMALPLRAFPRVIPVQVLRIGAVLIVGLPFELTVETGRRIERAVLDATRSDGIASVIVSSVANEYAGYAATPEEYALQHYEGAHTLYGPATQPVLTARCARLAVEVVRAGGRPLHRGPAERRFDLRVRVHLPRPSETVGGPLPGRRFVGRARFTDPTRLADGYWEQEWLDAAPGDLDWHEPIVRVEVCDVDEPPAPPTGRRGEVWRTLVDDQGWSLQVTHRGPETATAGGHRYAVRWWDPTFRAGRRHRFVLPANRQRPPTISAEFG